MHLGRLCSEFLFLNFILLLVSCFFALLEMIQSAMLEAFGNDSLGSLFEACHKSTKARSLLTEVCAAVLQNIMTLEEGMSEQVAELPEQIHAVFASVKAVTQAILALLVPVPNYMKSSAKDVLRVTNAKTAGADLPEDSLLSMTRLALQAPFWKGLVSEVSVKAGAAKELGPSWNLCVRSLQIWLASPRCAAGPCH